MLLSELDEAKVPLELVRAMLREILLAIVTLRVDVVAEAGNCPPPLSKKVEIRAVRERIMVFVLEEGIIEELIAEELIMLLFISSLLIIFLLILFILMLFIPILSLFYT